MTVDFGYVPEGLVFREMVLHIQDALLSGGVPTNIFRPKKRKTAERPLQVQMMVDSMVYAEQAIDYLASLDEVSDVFVDQPGQSISFEQQADL